MRLYGIRDLQMRKSRVSLIAAVLVLLVGVPLIMLVMVYVRQDRMLFFPVRLTESDAERIAQHYPYAEEITLFAPDGIALHGWFVKSAAENPSPLLIYFGGNAEEISHMLPEVSLYRKHRSVVLVNYRGYGLSGGSPSEKNLFHDAELIYDTFAGRDDVDGSKISAMGRSLGTGVAVHLASVRSLSGIVLISPFESMADVGKRHYPFLPVSLMLRHPFDSLSLAQEIKTPAYVIIAADDRIVPPEHSMRLMERWGGPHRIRIIEGAGHNSHLLTEDVWTEINAFLDGL